MLIKKLGDTYLFKLKFGDTNSNNLFGERSYFGDM